MTMNNANVFQMAQQLRSDPIGFLQKSGYNIPSNLNDPNSIIQYLMNSGQVTQSQYDRARQMAAQFKK